MNATSRDISITLDVDWTDHPIITVQVTALGDTFYVLAGAANGTTARHLILYDLHVHAARSGPNSRGWVLLRRLAHTVMEALDVDSITIGGAVRTTGAGPGRRPRPIRFKRVAGP